MQIARCFPTAGQDPYAVMGFRTATSEIRHPDGSVVFQAERIEVPAEWSQVAADIPAQKYSARPVFRRCPTRPKRACRPAPGGVAMECIDWVTLGLLVLGGMLLLALLTTMELAVHLVIRIWCSFTSESEKIRGGPRYDRVGHEVIDL